MRPRPPRSATRSCWTWAATDRTPNPIPHPVFRRPDLQPQLLLLSSLSAFFLPIRSFAFAMRPAKSTPAEPSGIASRSRRMWALKRHARGRSPSRAIASGALLLMRRLSGVPFEGRMLSQHVHHLRRDLQALRTERERISAELDVLRSAAAAPIMNPTIVGAISELEVKLTAVNASIQQYERDLDRSSQA